MPVAIPIAGVVGILANIALSIAVLAGALILLAFAIWALDRAAGYFQASPIPLIGAAPLAAVLALRSRCVELLEAQQGYIADSLRYLGFQWTQIMGVTLGPIILPIQALLNQAWGALNAHDSAIRWLQVEVAEHIPAVLLSHDAAIRWLQVEVAEHIPAVLLSHDAAIRALQGLVGGDMLPRLERAEARLLSQAGQLAQLEGQLAVVGAFLPALQGLGAFEGGVTGQLGGLRSAEAALAAQLAGLRQLVATYGPLAALAALSVADIAELVELARDPCRCLNTGGFSDLPDRVSALEGLGP